MVDQLRIVNTINGIKPPGMEPLPVHKQSSKKKIMFNLDELELHYLRRFNVYHQKFKPKRKQWDKKGHGGKKHWDKGGKKKHWDKKKGRGDNKIIVLLNNKN